jgi:outer membrane protein
MRRVLIAMLLAAIFGSTFAVAETPVTDVKPLNVATATAIVDVQRILQESTAAKSVQKQLEAHRAAFQKEISAEEKKLTELESQLKQDRAKISEEAYGVREQQLRQQFLTVEREVQARRRALDQAFNDAMGVVRTNLLAVVESLARSRGITLVLQKQQAMWHDHALDVTGEVLRQLDAKLANVAVDIKPQDQKKNEQNQATGN